MSSLVNLKYCLYSAMYLGENRHAQVVMNELGIEYEKAVPQSIADMWEFFGCNIPAGLELPPFLTVAKW